MDMVDAGLIVFGPVCLILLVYGILDARRAYKEGVDK